LRARCAHAQILPTRVRSIEEWMKKVDYQGVTTDVLKDRKDKNLVRASQQ
jgi:hypothetical protein